VDKPGSENSMCSRNLPTKIEEGLREYRAGKTRKIRSLADLG